MMIYAFDRFAVDATAFELRCSGERIAVEPMVLDLLLVLLRERDRIVSKEELLREVWGGRPVSDSALSSRVKQARKAIGDSGSAQRLIRTVHGRGFRFVGDVVLEDRDRAAADAVPGAVAADTGPRASETATPPSKRSAAREIASTAPATPGPQTRYARSGDVHIAYHLFGTGPTELVLAPGFVSHIDNYWADPHFARWLRRLGRFARVAMFDKRGAGLSDQVGTLPGMDERMDDVRAVMDAVGFEQAVIMGISEGGSLACLFAASHPDRSRTLVLYGAFAQFSSWFPTEAALQALFDYIETDWGTGKSLPSFAPCMAGDPAFTDWWGKFERLGANPGAARALMRMNSEIDVSGVLPSIQCPTLVIHRSEDLLIDVEGGRYLAAHIPGARYVELPGVDHLPYVGDASGIAVRFLAGFAILSSWTDVELRVTKAGRENGMGARVGATPTCWAQDRTRRRYDGSLAAPPRR